MKKDFDAWNRCNHFYDLDIQSGILRICDTSMFYDCYRDIDLSPGKYQLFAFLDDAGNSIGVDIVNDKNYNVGQKLDTMAIAFSQIGFYDFPIAAARFSEMDNAAFESYYALLNNTEDFGILSVSISFLIPFIRCTGMIDIYELTRCGYRIGIRIDFDVADEENDDK